jgi:hypothetical protein
VKIAGIYSFNGGTEYIQAQFPSLLAEVEQAIQAVDAELYRTKTSAEKTMPGKKLFSPKGLNRGFKEAFVNLGWPADIRVLCQYPVQYYVNGYQGLPHEPTAFRSMDFVKDSLGVEVQFGKYAFMVYNVCAKMTIFHKQGFIQAGIEIVPVKEFASNMSTGVSYFEQFVWDLDQRGVSNLDIPVMIVGIT